MPVYKGINKLLSDSIALPFTEDDKHAVNIVKKRLCKLVPQARFAEYSIYRRSVDARKRESIKFVYTVLISFAEEIVFDTEALLAEGFRICPDTGLTFAYGSEVMSSRPIVVGTGPAGMFCALMLAQHGYKPIIIERGASLTDRVNAVNSFFSGSILNTETNVMFGAGGAGTFSDGKLVTRINDPLTGFVLNTLCEFGAPKEITVKAKPHIGTDLLRSVVLGILHKIEDLGGDVVYNCRFISETKKSGGVSLKTSHGDIFGGCVVLAIGHSARDTYKYLCDSGYSIVSKPFSVGVRIEHRREEIDSALYGKHAGDPRLGAAEYALSDTKSGRGVYTFCMCPGGQVIAASSEEGGVVVNGMSYHARNDENSNSALLVSIYPEDHGATPMSGIEFQRKLETAAYSLGGGDYTAPIETVGDYLKGQHKGLADPREILPTYTRKLTRTCDISEIFPDVVNDGLRRGISLFGKRLKGFDNPDAVLTAVESRSSAPLRIVRRESGCAVGNDLVYPCGEGAGYAGGITSAAVDGIKTALAIMRRFKPLN